MATTTKPSKLTLRVYQVGFGDCFLLTFHYAAGDKHVLIDFGSTARPKNAKPDLMMRVAKDIEAECGGKLHAVIATHRHQDHISGFTTNKNGKGTGDIIRALEPDVVIQPWTEDPKAKRNASDSTTVMSAPVKQFTSALQNMHEVSAAIVEEAKRMIRQRAPFKLVDQLGFIGEDNLSNLSAVQNLMTMAGVSGSKGKNFYLHYGTKSGLEHVLPGVTTHVIGPPNLEQSQKVRSQTSKDEEEFWHLRVKQAADYWQFQALAGQHITAGNGNLFPHYESTVGGVTPPHTRWFIRHMRSIRGEQLLGLVRALDSVMNNTSLILMFEIGSKVLLFPGDAQIENWSYALFDAKDKAKIRKLLAKVNLYKVGHHGSLNATPKTLWNLFHNRSATAKPKRLQTVVSTRADKHGDAGSDTEVPRETLVKALKAESEYFSTQQLKGTTKIREDFVIDL